MFLVVKRSKLFFYFTLLLLVSVMFFGVIHSIQKIFNPSSNGKELDLCCSLDRDIVPQQPPMKGHDVAEVQIQLERMGYYNGVIDGIYQGLIVETVKNVQRELGLEITGIVNYIFYEALYIGDQFTETESKEPPTGDLKIVIDLDRFTLTLYSDGEEYAKFPITTGTVKDPSPVGDFTIVDKAYMAGNTGFGTRWMRLSCPWGGYGIHGTNNPGSIGHMQSQGCIRLYNRDVEKLYDWVRVGTPVTINSNRWPPKFKAEYKKGMRGQDVVYVQRALRDFGFCPGGGTSFYLDETENQVKNFQRHFGLPETGIVDENILYLLRLR